MREEEGRDVRENTGVVAAVTEVEKVRCLSFHDFCWKG